MLDPCSPDGTDSDLDGLCNSQELASGSDPNDTCDPFEGDTDGDGLVDGVEDANGNGKVDPGETSPLLFDSDGDGLDDLAIGIPYADTDGIYDAGQVQVYLGTETGVAAAPVHLLKGTGSSEWFGFSMSGDRDLNNDGVPDLVVGAPGYEGTRGRAHIFLNAWQTLIAGPQDQGSKLVIWSPGGQPIPPRLREACPQAQYTTEGI